MPRRSMGRRFEFVSVIPAADWTREAKKRLAEPFFSQEQNGTGLGLWVSSEIVRK